MRLAEDIQVSEALRNGTADERVDFFLGGHDHEPLRRYAGEHDGRAEDSRVVDCTEIGQSQRSRQDVRIVKSGTDFSSLSCVKMHVGRSADGQAVLHGVAVEQMLDIGKTVLDTVAVADCRQRVETCLSGVQARMDGLGSDPLVHSVVDLEGRGTVIRSQDSNLGNMLAGVVREYYSVDIALVNSGGIRCDKVIASTLSECGGTIRQPLTVRDLIEIVPFEKSNHDQVGKQRRSPRCTRELLLGCAHGWTLPANVRLDSNRRLDPTRGQPRFRGAARHSFSGSADPQER